jgi:hypothetical protein
MRKKHNVVIKHMTPEEYEEATKQAVFQVSAKQKIYVDFDGNKFTYSQICDKVNNILGENIWQSKTIFNYLKMDHMENVHLLPTMAHDSILEHVRRGASDTLFYRKLGINLLQELLHPMPNFKINGVTRVHMR